MNKKPAPESGRSARKSSRLATIPSTEESLKPEVLKLGEIDTSPWDDFLLGELLLVSLIVFNGIEEGRAVPHFLVGLCLLKLRWLSRALALSLGGARLSLRSHPTNGKKKKKSKRRMKSNKREQTPTRSPRRTKMKLNQA